MTARLDDANSFLMGGDKVPSASFLKIGTSHEGEILAIRKSQQTDPDTRKPVFWENGDPMWQVVVTIQTDERDPEIEDDDGRRRFYLKYKMLDAVRDAIKAANAENGLEVGGWLGIEFTSQDKATSRVKSGTKHYEAWYELPDPNAEGAAFLAEGDPNDPGDDDGNEPDPEPEPEPVKPARARRGAAAKDESAAPARGRGRGTTAEPAASARGRGRGRAAADGGDPF